MRSRHAALLGLVVALFALPFVGVFWLSREARTAGPLFTRRGCQVAAYAAGSVVSVFMLAGVACALAASL